MIFLRLGAKRAPKKRSIIINRLIFYIWLATRKVQSEWRKENGEQEY